MKVGDHLKLQLARGREMSAASGGKSTTRVRASLICTLQKFLLQSFSLTQRRTARRPVYR